MVLTPNGEILTNNHVIEGATAIKVTDVGNAKTYTATVVGYDRTSDVAVLQLVGASGLRTVNLGNSSAVKSGLGVVGIGNAGGNGGVPSYAGGSITALSQSITASDQGDGTSESLTGLLATNAGIEPGDSGGPLVTSAGKVIGMDTAASAGFQFQAAGILADEAFAIPINTATSIAKQLESGKSSATVHVGPTAFLGVTTPPPASNGSGGGGGGGFGTGIGGGLQGSSGAEITQVFAGSPAAKAGIAAGDTVTSFDGKNVPSASALTTLIETEKPGASVKAVYLDAVGVRHTATVTLVAGPPQ
jgi:S1-C subfamily serine protease